MRKLLLGASAITLMSIIPHAGVAQVATVAPGKAQSMVLLPKFLGILPFDQAHKGAEEAAKELKNPTPLQFLGPTPQNSIAGQIEIVTNATTQGVNAATNPRSASAKSEVSMSRSSDQPPNSSRYSDEGR